MFCMFSTNVFAEPVFDGFFGQLSVGGVQGNPTENTYAYVYGSGDEAYQYFDFSSVKLAGSLSIGYSKKIDNLNYAISAFYNFSDSNFGTRTNSAGTVRQANIKNVFGLTFEPGYYLEEKTLVYGKIGAAIANAYISHPEDATLDDEVTGIKTGILFGFGTKYALTKNIFLGAELYQIYFPKISKTTDDGSIRYTTDFYGTYNYGGLTLGYKF